MTEQNHLWCRDTARDEAARAAEDAAAVPSIQHRDLPEQVALLWASLGDIIGRVVRLEGEMDAGQDEEAAPAVCDSASPAEGLRTERVTLEVTQRVEHYVSPSRWNWCRQLGSHAQPGESVRVVEDATIGTGDVFADVQCGSTADEIARLTAERDAAISERHAARAECERLRACADPFGEELAVIAAWERCAITADWPADEPETAVRCAASMEQEIVRLRARVAELDRAYSAECDARAQAHRELAELEAAPAASDADVVVVPQTVTAGNFAGIRWNSCCRQHRMAMDNAGVRWSQSTEPSRPEIEEAANAGGDQQEPVAWAIRWHEGAPLDDHLFDSEKVANVYKTNCNAGSVVPLYDKPPRGWLHLSAEDCAALYLARAVLDGVFVGTLQEKFDAARRLVAIRDRAIRAAGGEVE